MTFKFGCVYITNCGLNVYVYNVYENTSSDNITISFPEMHNSGCLTRNKIHIALPFVIICSINSNLTESNYLLKV